MCSAYIRRGFWVIGICSSVLLAAAPANAQIQSGAADSPILWEVDETFPLLPSVRVQELRELKTKSNARSVSDLYHQLASQWESGQPIVADVTKTKYDRALGEYASDYVRRKGDLIGVRAYLNVADQRDGVCEWRVVASGQSTPPPPIFFQSGVPCSLAAGLLLPVSTPVDIEVSVSLADGTRVHRVSAEAKQRVVVALGDSYSSGEGNPDIPAKYSGSNHSRPRSEWIFTANFAAAPRDFSAAVWWDRPCHRSLASWPVMATLWRALSDAERHTRHVVLHYGCSGAEIVDGGFLAQSQAPLLSRYLGPVRDGSEDIFAEASRVFSGARRSQVNSMYDDLCRGQTRKLRRVKVPVHFNQWATVEDCADMIPVDDLLISMGGNDLGFSKIVKGVLVAEDHRGGAYEVWNKMFLGVFRRMAEAMAMDDASEAADKFSPYYKDSILALMARAGASKQSTTVVPYPNPVVTDTSRLHGCVGVTPVALAKSASEKSITPERARTRDANLVFGHALRRLSMNIPRRGWTVEIKETEVAGFGVVFDKISKMQSEASKNGSVFHLASYGDEARFAGRRTCDPIIVPSVVALPFHLCDGESANCNLSKAMNDGEWIPRSPQAYRHYPRPGKELPRTMVYSMNESILSQRGWLEPGPSAAEVAEAISGTMHPTAEAHAVAADEIVRGWAARSMSVRAHSGLERSPSQEFQFNGVTAGDVSLAD